MDLQPLPDYGVLMTLDEFVEDVSSGMLIDYDGIGYYAIEKGYSRNHPAIPSRVYLGSIDRNWTHVMWFNR